MENTYVENRLFELPLPEALTTLTANINNFIVPRLNKLISELESDSDNNNLLNLLSFLILLLIVKNVVANLFEFKAP